MKLTIRPCWSILKSHFLSRNFYKKDKTEQGKFIYIDILYFPKSMRFPLSEEMVLWWNSLISFAESFQIFQFCRRYISSSSSLWMMISPFWENFFKIKIIKNIIKNKTSFMQTRCLQSPPPWEAANEWNFLTQPTGACTGLFRFLYRTNFDRASLNFLLME